MATTPFFMRRLALLSRGARVRRETPDLNALAAISDPDRFVWSMLPHAARSFASSILLLPETESRSAAVAYLYARMLDTYEDHSPHPTMARESIQMFARRFGEDAPAPAPSLWDPAVSDDRDRAHVLLIERHQMVDRVFLDLDRPSRDRIVRLIEGMAAGMVEFSAIFEDQGGVLRNDRQVLDYCHRVIGKPALFVIDTVLGGVDEDQAADAMAVAELVQLANITRDVEKDLERGIAYHPILEPHLGSAVDDEIAVDVARARRDLMLLARTRAPSFRRLVDLVDLPRLSPARAAAVMMMLHTDRHYSRWATSVGLTSWSGPRRPLTMALASFPAAISPRWANRMLIRIERDLLATS